jgi:hypothetical protein
MATDSGLPSSFSRSRKFALSANLLVMLAAMVALVLMLNYLAARHHVRWSWSDNAQAKLSPLTEKVLAGVTNPVRVILYFRKEDPLFEMSWNLLKAYQFANDKIELESVDYDTQPGAAEVIKTKYQLSQKDRDVVIFFCKGSKKVVYQGELSVLDLQPLLSGQSQEIRRTHFKGEMMFTSALLTVTSPRKPKAYFLEDHGEHDPGSEDSQLGYSRFGAVLQENNVGFEKINLAGPGEVPPDCNLLIVAGARAPLLPEVLDKIDRYLKQGGRLLALFFPYALAPRQIGLENTLLNWGVSVGRDVVRDEKNSMSADMSDLVVSLFSTSHKLMQPLLGFQIYLVLPRSVSKDRSAVVGADAPQVDLLATSGPNGRVIRDVRPQGVIHAGAGDVTGTIPVMAAVEKGGIRNVISDRGATRLVVVGDSLFLSNNNIDRDSNHEFASHAVNWLLARDELLVPVPPKPIPSLKLTMTASQMSGARWLLMGALPGVALALGALVWLRRRR